MSRRSIIAASSVRPRAQEELFCHDLPSVPRPEMGRILVTGASGYVGGRLVPELLDRGYRVRVMVRAESRVYGERWPEAEIVEADVLDRVRLNQALEDVYAAYFLIHSLTLGPREFARVDLRAAVNFRKAAEINQVKRIIYLGGLGNVDTPLSDHLRTRMKVAEKLACGPVPVTTLRAAVIVGSGGASYEIIHHLVKKVPIIPVPHWARTECQPLAIRDVIKYLVGVLETPATAGQTLDIGGPDILTYESMLRIFARLLHKRRIFFRCPLSYIGLYAYLISFLTPVPANIIHRLMECLKNAVVCQDNSITGYLPFRVLGYEEAVVRAMSREERDIVHTRWSDAYPPDHVLAVRLRELDEPPLYTASYSLSTRESASALFASISKIGGREGWFHGNWMWRLRGWMDRVLLGVGSSRGRRSHSSLETNDVIDFWRVEDVQQDRWLLLRAEMKLPGRAWLEFVIDDEGRHRRLSVNAYYDTHTILGRAYWYLCLPFHWFIFGGLIRQIEIRSRSQGQPP